MLLQNTILQSLTLLSLILISSVLHLAYSESRILGGFEIQISKCPWQVCIQRKKNVKLHCGGGILSTKWILTAGHCGQSPKNGMINNANLFQIRVGSSTSKEGGQVYNIKQIIVHPKYTHKNIDYDLSLFELKKPLTMGPNVKALTLPPQGKNSPNGAQLLLTGFGKISDTESTNTLMGQYVNIFGRKACNKYFKKMKVEEITETMLCINGLKNNGFCSGDSGGVLMEKDSEVAVGLVSHHFGKCSASNPKVITKVSFFTNWIKKTIGN